MTKRIIKIYFEGRFIHYTWNRGSDWKLWTGIHKDTEEIFDYNSKNELKLLAEKEGYDWEVYKHNTKTKDLELVEASYIKNKTIAEKAKY